VSLKLVVEILGDATGLAKATDSATGKLGGLDSVLGGNAVKVAAVAGVAGIAAAALWDMTDAAAADRSEQQKLEAAIAAAGAATATSNAEVEAAIAAGQDRAFTDSQTRDALQSLVTATGDVSAATGLLTQAQDIARLAGVDLATAADAVAKAQAGQDGPLRKLIPGLEKGASATDTLAAATAAAAGQADIYANSADGMKERGADAFGELGETIGSAFLPILDAILPALIPIIKAFGTLVTALLPILTPALKLVATVLGFVANALAVVVGWLAKLVSWVADATGAIGRFLDSINPLKDIKLPSLPFLNSTGTPTSAAAATRGLGASSRAATAAPSITIYTTGDGIEAEQAVVRALRRVTRLNGGVVPALGWSGAGP
jgi:hypothetical protein